MRLRPEQELVVYCGELYENQEVRRKIGELLGKKLNWDYIQEYAKIHGLLPFVWLHLKRSTNSYEISKDTLKKLAMAYYKGVYRAKKLAVALSRILVAFNKEGVLNIPLKGAALFDTVYSGAPFRLHACGDIDILIHKRDFGKVNRILTGLGYLPLPLSRYQWNYYYAAFYVKLHEAIRLDIHWDLFPKLFPYRMDIKTVWENAIDTTIGNINTLAMSCEDHVLYLCTKLFVDLLILRYIRLLSLCDIARTVRYCKNQMNWSYILDKTEKWNLILPVYFPLHYANMFYETPTPAEVLLKFRRRIITIRNLARLILLEIFWGKNILRTEKEFPFINLEDALSKRKCTTEYRFHMTTFLLLHRRREQLFWLKKNIFRFFHKVVKAV